MLPWRCATSSHLHVIWMDENSRGSLTTVNTNASPRLAARTPPCRLRHEYLEQLVNAAVWRHRRLFEPYLHIQGRPDSLLKVQKSKDCILRASISSVFAQNNLIILFHFQVTLVFRWQGTLISYMIFNLNVINQIGINGANYLGLILIKRSIQRLL